jgi:hypothetical protein
VQAQELGRPAIVNLEEEMTNTNTNTLLSFGDSTEHMITVEHGKRAYVAARTDSRQKGFDLVKAIRPTIGKHGHEPAVKLWQLVAVNTYHRAKKESK